MSLSSVSRCVYVSNPMPFVLRKSNSATVLLPFVFSWTSVGPIIRSGPAIIQKKGDSASESMTIKMDQDDDDNG